MQIITLVTKRSVRETDTSRRYRRFYSTQKIKPGSMIEIIDGNRKSPAIILKNEPSSVHKQAIRDGSLHITKLRLSRSGNFKNGTVVDSFPLSEIKKYLKDPNLAKATGNPHLSSFFPSKRKTSGKARDIPATQDGQLTTLSLDRYRHQTKTHSTELQLYVDEVRTYFQENARYGKGSFSYYLGFCKKIPLQDLWQIFGEAKQAKNKTRFEQKKLFWWKIGQYLRATKA